MRKFGMFSRERKKSFVWVQVEQQRFFPIFMLSIAAVNEQILDKCLIGNQFSCLFFSQFLSCFFLCSDNIPTSPYTHIHIMHDMPQSTEFFLSLPLNWIYFQESSYEGRLWELSELLFYCQEYMKVLIPTFFFFFYCQSLNIEWWRERVEFPRLCISTRVKKTRTEIQVKFRVCCVREKNVECEVSVPVLFFFLRLDFAYKRESSAAPSSHYRCAEKSSTNVYIVCRRLCEAFSIRWN